MASSARVVGVIFVLSAVLSPLVSSVTICSPWNWENCKDDLLYSTPVDSNALLDQKGNIIKDPRYNIPPYDQDTPNPQDSQTEESPTTTLKHKEGKEEKKERKRQEKERKRKQIKDGEDDEDQPKEAAPDDPSLPIDLPSIVKPPVQTLRALKVGFYKESCPRAEQIVREALQNIYNSRSNAAASIVRLHSHDCLVTGCDASILLDKTPSGEKVEKESPVNQMTLGGFDIIDEIKAKLEQECLGVVSCADALAFAARDGLSLSSLPNYEVPAGRRDSLVSREANVLDNIPGPETGVDELIKIFARYGLTEEDLVVLIGAHSIGEAHCSNCAYRMAKQKDLDGMVATNIRQVCRDPRSNDTLPIDGTTQFQMDVDFYKQLLERRGLLESDQYIADNPRTRVIMGRMASNEKEWHAKFAAAMVKMGGIHVLSGAEGQIRNQCRAVN